MHFRIRRNVVQLVRTNYDPETKKPKAQVIGRLPLMKPEISEELRKLLTQDEVLETQTWIERQHRTSMLQEELAALTLAENLMLANRWFQQQDNTVTAAKIADGVLTAQRLLKKNLKQEMG